MIKVYCYYKHRMNPYSTKYDLYAWTENKQFARVFESTRCMENFHKEVLSFEEDDLTIRTFRQDYSSLMMISIPLYTQLPSGDTTDIEIIGTYEEDSTLSTAIDYLVEQLDEVQRLTKVFLKGGLIKHSFAKKIIKYVRYADEEEPTFVNMDTYRMFFNLFRETFLNYRDLQKLLKQND